MLFCKKNHKKNSISDRIDKTQEIEAHIAAKYYKKKNSQTKSSVAWLILQNPVSVKSGKWFWIKATT